jgi:hypothetical protein
MAFLFIFHPESDMRNAIPRDLSIRQNLARTSARRRHHRWQSGIAKSSRPSARVLGCRNYCVKPRSDQRQSSDKIFRPTRAITLFEHAYGSHPRRFLPH